MRDNEDKRLGEFLKQHLPPAQGTLSHDLWPKMIDCMNESPLRRVLWWDWALFGLVVLLLIAIPDVIPMLLYQL